MLHDRTSFYEKMLQRKSKSAVFSFFFTIYEYITLVGYALLHFSPGKWLFRTPSVYVGTGALWSFIATWFLFGPQVVDFLNDSFDAGIFYQPVPAWLLWTAIVITVAFLIHHNITSGMGKELDDLYSGYPWLLGIFRLITFRKFKADEKEEIFFKEFIEPAYVLAFGLLITEPPLTWLLIVLAVCLFTRERMIKHFYEVNRVNVQDVINRAEEVAAGAGMKVASRGKKAPKVGRINPNLRNPRTDN